jgi:GH25 family lysozyme M1 (1,4-beta-N-acetylmuramidase)
MAKISLGNDISRWQGDVNYDVFKDNTNFVIIKATEGNGFTDPKFTRNQSEARRVGLPLGYYHFARPDLGNSPEVEADYFLKVVGIPVKGEVYVLDYEPKSNPGDTVDWCKKFLDHVFAKIQTKPLIYLNQAQIKAFNWKPIVDAGYGLWVAAYTYDPNKNDFEKGSWPFAAIQQWTNQQQVPGVTGNVDGNVFFGSIETFKKYGYQPPQPTSIPQPEPTPDPQPNPEPADSQEIKQLKEDIAKLDGRLKSAEESIQNASEVMNEIAKNIKQKDENVKQVFKEVKQSLEKTIKALEGGE